MRKIDFGLFTPKERKIFMKTIRFNEYIDDKQINMGDIKNGYKTDIPSKQLNHVYLLLDEWSYLSSDEINRDIHNLYEEDICEISLSTLNKLNMQN